MNKAKEKFRQVFGDGINFVTPDVIRYGKAGRFYYELSEGYDTFEIFGDQKGRVYGVTIIEETDHLERRDKISFMFRDREKVDEYINVLKEGNEENIKKFLDRIKKERGLD